MAHRSLELDASRKAGSKIGVLEAGYLPGPKMIGFLYERQEVGLKFLSMTKTQIAKDSRPIFGPARAFFL